MKCPHCSQVIENADYQVPQTTVYPDINKCYQGGYTTNAQELPTQTITINGDSSDYWRGYWQAFFLNQQPLRLGPN